MKPDAANGIHIPGGIHERQNPTPPRRHGAVPGAGGALRHIDADSAAPCGHGRGAVPFRTDEGRHSAGSGYQGTFSERIFSLFADRILSMTEPAAFEMAVRAVFHGGPFGLCRFRLFFVPVFFPTRVFLTATAPDDALFSSFIFLLPCPLSLSSHVPCGVHSVRSLSGAFYGSKLFSPFSDTSRYIP